jgi:hypothetical protein
MTKIAREKVQAPLVEFLRRELARQGGKSLRLTSNMNLRIMALASGDVERQQSLGGFLESQKTNIEDLSKFADQIVARLPTLVEQDAVDKLRFGSGDRPPTAQEQVEKAMEPPAPEEGERQVLVERASGKDGSNRSSLPEDDEARIASSPQVHGPKNTTTIAVPLNKIPTVAGWLRRGKDPDAPQAPKPNWYPEVEQAIKNLDATALVPSDAWGTPGESNSNYADARLVATRLALNLDVAQQTGTPTVDLHLPVSYLAIKSLYRVEILRELEEIIRTVRAALPHHASKVESVTVYFGKKIGLVVQADPVSLLPTSLQIGLPGWWR